MSWYRILRIGALTFLLAIIIWAALNRDSIHFDELISSIDDAGPWAALAFIALYVLSAVLFIPALILTILAGAIFGLWLGFLYSITGATLGAICAFLISRHLAADMVLQRLDKGRLSRLSDGIEAEGWRFIAFTRLVPLFPYNALNYAFGLTRVRLWDYVWATAVFMIPGGFAYVYLGYAGRKVSEDGTGSVGITIIAIALLAAVFYLPRFVKRLRHEEEE